MCKHYYPDNSMLSNMLRNRIDEEDEHTKNRRVVLVKVK
jgi:hypothetical protein